MTMLVADPYVERGLIAEPKAKGLDRCDEVWQGVYVIIPSLDNEHQDLVFELSAIGAAVIKRTGLGDRFPAAR